jgi:hypothetical protein
MAGLPSCSLRRFRNVGEVRYKQTPPRHAMPTVRNLPIEWPGMLMADVAGVEAGVASALLAAALALPGGLLLLRAVVLLRGTTLVAPCLWALAAIVAVAGSEVALGLLATKAAAADAWRMAAAILSLCPTISILGAKRPQYLPWQFIVLSLWVVLALPALEVLVIHPGQPLERHAVRAWFLLVLVLLGLAVQLGARYWPSAALAVIAQALLLWAQLPLVGFALGAGGALAALALADVAILLATAGIPRRGKPTHPLDRLWVDFRDAYGALWAMRLAERLNAVARQSGWDAALHWEGFTRADGTGKAADLSPQIVTTLQHCLNNLLRRFVSARWIESRVRDKLE